MNALHLHSNLALMAAIAAAAAMGAAIQHGGTCVVAAVDQVLSMRSAQRLAALAECSLWAAVLGMMALGAGFHFAASPSYPAGWSAAAGGAMLGFGAWLNGACVFGSIARIGSRDWHYLLTPFGFFAGSLIHARTLGPFATHIEPRSTPDVWGLLVVLATLSAGYSAWQLRHRRRAALWGWRHATIAIGFAFVALASLAGPWTYTEALGRAAHNGSLLAWQDAALFAALLGGAVAGGGSRPSATQFAWGRAASCAAGGAFMGFGGALVPGGNDNLILVGLPALQAHAWLAIAAMVLTIAGGLLGSREYSKMRLLRSESRAEPV